MNMSFLFILHTHVCIATSTLAFVTRFTAAELPPHIKKHIEDDFQEWEENLFKVTTKFMNHTFSVS